ncbi:MAG: AMP-binding protein [Candidatus Thorarchaeota archaeon]
MESPYANRFWRKSWDKGLTDLNPNTWEISYTDAVRDTFDSLSDKMALTYQGLEITFGQLDEFSNQFANMLIDNGFHKGDVVGINLPNIPEYPIVLIGTLKAGCIVSGVSPLMSDVQMQYQLSDLGVGEKKVALVTLDAIFEHRLTPIASTLPQLKLVIWTSVVGSFPKEQQERIKAVMEVPTGTVTPLEGKTVLNFQDDALANYSNELPNLKVSPDDIAFIQYTGGTTGPPKGAMLTHRNCVADIAIVQKWLGWDRGSKIALSGFPFFHIAGTFFFENCLWLGWGQVLIPNPRDTQSICNEMKKYKPTALVNVPSLYQLLINTRKFKRLDHSNLEFCISAASPFPVESQKDLESIVGEGKLLEVYGMTETSPLTTMNPFQGERKLGSIGLPLLNTELKLVDPDTGEEVPLGEPGEICVKGPQVMKGYYNKPEETEKAIDKDGFIHTGDVAIMDEEGYLRIVDRTKDMIIVGGYKVFSAKLEDTLTKHPAIEMVATIGLPNPDRPGSEIVKAYIQLDPDYEYDGDEEALKESIIAFAREHCAPYEVPKLLEISEELPLTVVGKVDKKLLRKSE